MKFGRCFCSLTKLRIAVVLACVVPLCAAPALAVDRISLVELTSSQDVDTLLTLNIGIVLENDGPRSGVQFAIRYNSGDAAPDSSFTLTGRSADLSGSGIRAIDDSTLVGIFFDEDGASIIEPGSGPIAQLTFHVDCFKQPVSFRFAEVLLADENIAAVDSVETSGLIFGCPTPIALSDFAVYQREDGAAVVSWTSPFSATFRVLRSASVDSPYVQISHEPTSGEGRHTVVDQSEIIRHGGSFFYALDAISRSGDRERYGPIELVAEDLSVPRVFALGPATPNPMREATTIVMEIPRRSDVRLDVFDVAGRLVRTLVNYVVEAGRVPIVWDGRRDEGTKVSQGIYFFQIRTDGFRASKKLIVLK